MSLAPGAVAEWLRSGLQSRVHQFDSGRRLSPARGSGEADAKPAERVFRRAEDALERSRLPAQPDRERIDRLCVEVASAVRS